MVRYLFIPPFILETQADKQVPSGMLVRHIGRVMVAVPDTSSNQPVGSDVLGHVFMTSRHLIRRLTMRSVDGEHFMSGITECNKFDGAQP